MRPIDRQLAQDEIFQSIVSDFTYPVVDPSGPTLWRNSGFQFEQLFQRIRAEEALVEALKKSQGDTYLFDKTLTSTSIRRQYPAGRHFYDWIDKASLSPVPEQYEPSYEARLLAGFASHLGITKGMFMQPDPLSPVPGGKLLQGELIDAFGRRIFETMKKAAVKEAISARNKEIQSAVSRTERYFGRMENNYPELGVRRVELHYKDVSTPARKSVEMNALHLDNLIALLQETDKTGIFVGYWWKRRYLPEWGYGFHLIQFIDVKAGHPLTLLSRTLDGWKEVTNGSGIVFVEPLPLGNHRYWASSAINTPYVSPSPLDEVTKSVRMMLESERYLRLLPDPKRDHWGMGDLPPAVNRGKELHNSGEVKSLFDKAAETIAAPSSPQ